MSTSFKGHTYNARDSKVNAEALYKAGKEQSGVPTDLQVISGSNARFFHRQGINSINDQASYIRNKQTYEENLGAGEAIFTVMRRGAGGKYEPAANTPLSLGGKTFMSNAEGIVRMVDEGVIQERLKPLKERERYVRTITENALYSDEVCATYLGMSVEDLHKLTKPNGELGSISKELNNYEASPDFLGGFPSDSPIWANGCMKLKKIIEAYLPALLPREEQTDSNDVNVNVEQ